MLPFTLATVNMTTIKQKAQEKIKKLYDNDSSKWTVLPTDSKKSMDVLMYGPPNTPYENGTFWVHIELGTNFPLRPPVLKMRTQIYHPSINKMGNICLSTVDEWIPENTIQDCLNTLYQALKNPPAAQFTNEQAGFLFYQAPKKFKQIAKQWTKEYAMSKVL